MPNMLELKRRHGEISTLVAKALDDERAGRLTSKQFVATVNPLMEEADEVDGQMKAYSQSCVSPVATHSMTPMVIR
jgi:hypothetical protein